MAGLGRINARSRVAGSDRVDNHAACSKLVDGQALLDHAPILEAGARPDDGGQSEAHSEEGRRDAV